jgi:hypothetical protein
MLKKYQNTGVTMSLESIFSKYELLVAHKLERRGENYKNKVEREIDQRYKVFVLFVGMLLVWLTVENSRDVVNVVSQWRYMFCI